MAMSITAIATTSAPRGTARSAAQASAASAVTEPSVATRIRLMATWLLPFVSPQTGPESQPPSPPHQGHCPLGGGPIGTNAGLTGRGSARRRLSPALVTGSPSQQQLSDLLDREDGADECSEHKPPPRVESRGAEQPLKGRGVDQGGSKEQFEEHAQQQESIGQQSASECGGALGTTSERGADLEDDNCQKDNGGRPCRDRRAGGRRHRAASENQAVSVCHPVQAGLRPGGLVDRMGLSGQGRLVHAQVD